MKIKLSFCFFLLFSVYCANAQIVNIPDPNFKHLLVHYNHDGVVIDTNGDGEIQYTEAAAITVLGVGDPNISLYDVSDLTGIEAFVNLVELYCPYNNLTSLDLSQNTALEILVCDHNNLSSINISQNTALKKLYCYDNELVSLDVTQNTALEKLRCEENQLSDLDVIQNVHIEFLSCYDNNISSLDLTQNSELEILWANNNQLIELDIKNGNNANIIGFNTTNNPDLTCIFVEDADYSQANWTAIDPASTFVETQQQCDDLAVMENFLQRQIKIYPNPVNNRLYIESNLGYKNPELEYKLCDILGQKIRQGKFSKKTLTIDFSKYRQGLYFLRIKSSDKLLLTTKLIKL